MRLSSLLLGAVVLAAHSARAQSLASRIDAAGDGAVTFSFAARPEACGDGQGVVSIGRSQLHYSGGALRPCVHGPVQVRLTLRDGAVERVESWVGVPRPRDGRELGTVPAREAAGYLLGLASGVRGTASKRAIVPAVLADSAEVWPALLGIARDSSSGPRAVRTEASFWLSRFAIAAIAGHATSLRDDDVDERDDVKLHAVFVLSQLPNREGIAPLLDVARSRADLAVRQRALFWLGQSGDPRALALFESILRS